MLCKRRGLSHANRPTLPFVTIYFVQRYVFFYKKTTTFVLLLKTIYSKQ